MQASAQNTAVGTRNSSSQVPCHGERRITTMGITMRTIDTGVTVLKESVMKLRTTNSENPAFTQSRKEKVGSSFQFLENKVSFNNYVTLT